jgi:hypothetical protein
MGVSIQLHPRTPPVPSEQKGGRATQFARYREGENVLSVMGFEPCSTVYVVAYPL